MIGVHNIDPGSALHPASRGCAVHIPAQSSGAIVAAIADTSAVVGTALTLVTSGTSGIGPGGFLPCSPLALAITTGVGASCTLRFIGINQFGKQVTEDLACGANTNAWTLNAYKQVLSITPTVLSAAGTNIAVGFIISGGVRIGLPFRPANSTIPTTTLASFQARLEVVGLVTNNGAGFVQTAAGAVSERYATLTLTGNLTAGLNWLVLNFLQRGFREK